MKKAWLLVTAVFVALICYTSTATAVGKRSYLSYQVDESSKKRQKHRHQSDRYELDDEMSDDVDDFERPMFYSQFAMGGGQQFVLANSDDHSFSAIVGRGALGIDLYNAAVNHMPIRFDFGITVRSYDPNLKTVTKPAYDPSSYNAEQQVSLSGFTVQVYYDLHNNTPFTPFLYVNSGLSIPSAEKYTWKYGYGYEDEYYSKYTRQSLSFTFGAGVGVSLEISPSWAVDISTSYNHSGGGIEAVVNSIDAFDVLIGFRFYYF